MKKRPILQVAALVLAILLTLCGCEIDLTNLVTDVVLITSKEASSEDASTPTAEVSSETEASSAPAESEAEDTTTSEPEPEPEPEPDPGSEPLPVPMPEESDTPSVSSVVPSSRPASSTAASSSETSSAATSSKPSTNPRPSQSVGPYPHPWADLQIYKFGFRNTMEMLPQLDVADMREIGVTYSTVLTEDLYGGVYTDPEIISALIELVGAAQIEYLSSDLNGDGVETCPISFYVIFWDDLLFCPTFYLKFEEERIYINVYEKRRCYRYEIVNAEEIRPLAKEIYTMITGKTLGEE